MGNGPAKQNDITKVYEIGANLGTGSFAVVKLAVHKKTGKEFALKVIKKKSLNEEELATINDEVEILQRVTHANIVQLVEIFDTSKNLFMVLELLTGGELFDRVVAQGSFSEKDAARVTSDITGAVQYLHNIGIVHRDLKPENLLYKSKDADSNIKITDFGLAKFVSDGDAMSTPCGTPGYVAPEILKSEPYGPAVDMWSIGVILYILLCGFPPFYDESATGLYDQIKRGDYDFPDPYWTDISAEAKDLVSRLLTVDPEERITSAEVMSHPWVSGDKASGKQLGPGYQRKIMAFNARRKLRKAINMIIALNKLSRNIDFDFEEQ